MYRMNNSEEAFKCYMCNASVPLHHPNSVIVCMEQYLPEELTSGDPAIDFSHSFDICALCFQAILLPFIRSNSFDNYHGKNVVGEDLRNHVGTKCP